MGSSAPACGWLAAAFLSPCAPARLCSAGGGSLICLSLAAAWGGGWGGMGEWGWGEQKEPALSQERRGGVGFNLEDASFTELILSQVLILTS